MPEQGASCEANGGTTLSSSTSPAAAEPCLGFCGAALDGEVDSVLGAPETEKDPRKIARNYQLGLCKRAMQENIIVYLGTGCGKTHIAVLLIYEMGHLIRKPQRDICVFVAPTVALVQQQGKVLEESLDFKVGVYCKSSKHLKTHQDWGKEIGQHEILVMTPLILFRNLSHCFIKMESISLLIFDECHHAQVDKNHPYAEVMRVFYKSDTAKRPRIFGMTASPIVGKGACIHADLPKSINSLEILLNAKVYSVEHKGELNRFVTSPVTKIYDYGPAINAASSSYMPYYIKLEEINRQCISTLSRKTDDHWSLKSAKRLLRRMHDNIIFCMENLGLCGVLQPHLLGCCYHEWDEVLETGGKFSGESMCKRYLAQAAEAFSYDWTGAGSMSDFSSVEILKEPFFSGKLLCLIDILSSFRIQPNMKCIVFVNRIVTARSLSYILQRLKFLAVWKCDFLVGVHSGLRNRSRKTMNVILEKFRSGELNLLVATKVAEEGLDIQTCCLVIRFDLPETVSSFIQSRGRARMPKSEYAFLVNSGNQKELDLIEKFKLAEDEMNMEIIYRTSNDVSNGVEEHVYKVASSGASSSSTYSISLLHQYCSKLPHDEFFDPKPRFFYYETSGGTVCHIVLPSNAPISKIVGSPQPSTGAAKKEACLKAIKELHNLGALSDHLLPNQEDEDKQGTKLVSFDSDSCEDEVSGELYEMLVPAALREPWTDTQGLVCFNFYYIKFTPVPADRSYKKFGLFVKTSLPEEAENMELDLHLAHSRSVMTKFVRLGVLQFDKNEIALAQKFQEMFLKVILDRWELAPNYVPLGKNDSCNPGTGTFYLLLPLNSLDHENMLTVDWAIIKRCLASPIFKAPADPVDKEIFTSDAQLHLANGRTSISNIKNSLVYSPHNGVFFFITNIQQKNGYSPYKDSDTISHEEHLIARFDIRLRYPEQPLLRGKSLFCLRNLLHRRKHDDTESSELDEHFIDLPPELCELKIIGFSKDIGSSLSLLPSIMHRLENLLVAIEFRQRLSASFSEGAEVTANRVLEALTTEKCQERFSLERLEILGDAFLKFAVGRHHFLLYDILDEGELTRRRSNEVNNDNLFKLATRNNLQAYIRDRPFDPHQFFAFGRPCRNICNKESKHIIHDQYLGGAKDYSRNGEVRCSKGHHWLYKKTIADVVEALVGAFIVDSGFRGASEFLRWIGIAVDFEASQVINVCLASNHFLPLTTCVDVTDLENSMGYQFQYRGLLLQAFVHPSCSKHGGGCYQRLEFLGDAVLDFLITSYLYSVYPNLKPGQLTDIRSAYVNNKAFASVAVDRSFDKFLISDSRSLSEAIKDYVHFIRRPPSEKGSISGPKCPKALGDLVESCLGAILLDTGFDLKRVWNIMLSFLDPIMSFSSLLLSPKRELIELCQVHNLHLEFPSTKNNRIFLVKATVTGKDVCVTGSASNTNKKDAIRTAARHALKQLKAQGYLPKAKSLEDILQSTRKEEAKLIGYDETPVNLNYLHSRPGFENLTIDDPFDNKFEAKIYPMGDFSNAHSSCQASIRSQPLSSHADIVRQPHEASRGNISRTLGASRRGTARSRLYEICAANFWKPPLFNCCKEEGLSHVKLFTYKVVLEIEEAPAMTLECYGAPRSKKRDAAEHAAEGAIWYLKKEGIYLVNSDKDD